MLYVKKFNISGKTTQFLQFLFVLLCDAVLNPNAVFNVDVEFTGRAVGLTGFFLLSKYSTAFFTQCFFESEQTILFFTVVNTMASTWQTPAVCRL